MNDRSENSLQTAARWGRNALIGMGVLYVVVKIASWWLEGVWQLFPSLRHSMAKKYGRDEARTNFMATGIAAIVTAPLWLLCALLIFSMVVEMLGLGDQFLRWETRFFDDLGRNHTPSTILLWIAFALMLPWVMSSSIEMLRGLKKSIRPHNDKRRTPAPVTRFALHLCFYLLAVPMFLVIFMVDDDPFVYTHRAWFLIVTVSLWIPMRWLCDKLMRHTGSTGRLVTAALLALVFTPVAARLIGLTGFYGALSDALRSLG